MEIDLIKKNEIIEYAKKAPQFFESDIPITTERAVSQSKNPDALDDDILLIVAREGRKLSSFIGVYPAIVGNDAEKRIYWVSCWWKAPGVSSEISRRVFNEYLNFSGDKTGVPHLPPHIIKVLESNNIQIKGRDGVMVRFRSAAHSRSLQRSLKGNFHKSIYFLRKAGLFRFLDLAVNSFRRKNLIVSEQDHDIDFHVSTEVPGDDYFSFIQTNFQNHITLPHRRNLEWMVNLPWLVNPGNMNKEILEKYHFSYVSEKFYHFFPVMRKGGEIVAAGFFSSRDGAVKSLFIFANDNFKDQYFTEILKFIQNGREYHTIISYEKPFVQFMENNINEKLELSRIKRFMGTGNSEYAKLEPTDGDGDSCFT